MNLSFRFDEKLREAPNDVAAVRAHVENLKIDLPAFSDPASRVSALGEIGSYARILGDLDMAESSLQEALRLIADHNLGRKIEVQQKIRLGNVLQWRGDFEQSNALFSEVLGICREDLAADVYLDFALQHAGKNFFDQGRYREALEYFREALQIRKKRKSPRDQIASTRFAIRRTKLCLRGEKWYDVLTLRAPVFYFFASNALLAFMVIASLDHMIALGATLLAVLVFFLFSIAKWRNLGFGAGDAKLFAAGTFNLALVLMIFYLHVNAMGI